VRVQNGIETIKGDISSLRWFVPTGGYKRFGIPGKCPSVGVDPILKVQDEFTAVLSFPERNHRLLGIDRVLRFEALHVLVSLLAAHIGPRVRAKSYGNGKKQYYSHELTRGPDIIVHA
jgi:hypothetical protein